MNNDDSNIPNNDLGMFFDGHEEIVQALSDVGKVSRVKVHHANFEDGRVIISINGADESFDGVMSAINFCRMTTRMLIKAVDFDTGEITIQWLSEEDGMTLKITLCGLSEEELGFMKNGRKIHAIKAHRRRTGAGLADSKDAVENGYETYQRKMGLIK